MTNELDMMIDSIGTGDYILGGHPAERIAQKWIDAGVTPAQAAAYIEAGCWDPDRVADLVAAGVTPEHLADEDVLASVVAAVGDAFIGTSLSYAHSNRDLATATIVAAVAEARS